jgi:hypothetical protein
MIVLNFYFLIYIRCVSGTGPWPGLSVQCAHLLTCILQGSPGNLVQFEDLLFSNVDLVVGTALIAVRLAGNPKARVSHCI